LDVNGEGESLFLVEEWLLLAFAYSLQSLVEG
jgi:hypothetical protein